MKKRTYFVAMALVSILALSACSEGEYGDESRNEDVYSEQNTMNENVYSEQNAVIEEDTEQSPQVSFKEENSELIPPEEDIQNASAKQDILNINVSDRSEVMENNYSMSVYTAAPNQNSSISIQYPIFEGSGKDALNNLIYKKVQEFAQIDTSFFPDDAGLTIDYQSAVTLNNEKIVSIVFWGSSFIEGASYGTDDLISLNIDLQTLEEITFEDLYTVDDNFEKTFFEKSYFPTEPITSYDEFSFAEMLKLQSPEYQAISPFSISGNVSCFMKPEGVVLSMPAIHATGSDHFEAQLNYSDIDRFYKPELKYWDE